MSLVSVAETVVGWDESASPTNMNSVCFVVGLADSSRPGLLNPCCVKPGLLGSISFSPKTKKSRCIPRQSRRPARRIVRFLATPATPSLPRQSRRPARRIVRFAATDRLRLRSPSNDNKERNDPPDRPAAFPIAGRRLGSKERNDPPDRPAAFPSAGRCLGSKERNDPPDRPAAWGLETRTSLTTSTTF
jgi:hypothetical protein